MVTTVMHMESDSHAGCGHVPGLSAFSDACESTLVNLVTK